METPTDQPAALAAVARLSLIGHQIVHALEITDVPAEHCVRSTTRFLAQTLLIGHGEATQRVQAHEALHPQITMVGEVLPPARPVLAAAQQGGSVSPNQAQVIISAMEKVERLEHLLVVTPELVAEIENTLTGYATSFDPIELRRCAERVVECIDPDGVLADERAQNALREVHLTVRKDGLYTLRGVLTTQAGAALSTVLLPLTAQRSNCAVEGETAGDDHRDYPARLHDAWEEAAHRLLRSGTLLIAGGVPATLLITVSESTLRADRGYGHCSDGSLVPVKKLSSWAGEAEVITVATTKSGEVLELGRQKRFATKNQTPALIARDKACTFPGCDHPPQWCERHHIKERQHGGATSIDNLTLLCRSHHHRFESRGWSCRMIDGLPHWIPPRWADPGQRLILNRRLSDRHHRDPNNLPCSGSDNSARPELSLLPRPELSLLPRPEPVEGSLDGPSRADSREPRPEPLDPPCPDPNDFSYGEPTDFWRTGPHNLSSPTSVEGYL